MMKHLIILLLLLPSTTLACQWKVKVSLTSSKDVKYYLADSVLPSEFQVSTTEGEPLAACSAKLQQERSNKDTNEYVQIESGEVTCAYIGIESRPIGVATSRLAYKNGEQVNNLAVMILYSNQSDTPRKPLATIIYSCNDDPIYEAREAIKPIDKDHR